MTGHAAKFRQALQRPGLRRLVGAHDALGARLAERAGFDAVWASGFELSAAGGLPDIGLVTMTEQLAASQSMARSVALPVLADCDTGYGDEHNVAHMVRCFEAAGVAAVSIEDKTFPKRNSFLPAEQELVPAAEFVAKLRAAKAAQHGRDFAVVARTEALVAGLGPAEALRRGRAYAAAGADAVLIHGKDPSPDEVLEVVRAWRSPVPLILVPTTYFTVTAAELEALGVRMVIYANHGLRSAVRAMEETFARILATGSTAAVEGEIASLAEIFALQGVPARLAGPGDEAGEAEPVSAVA